MALLTSNGALGQKNGSVPPTKLSTFTKVLNFNEI